MGNDVKCIPDDGGECFDFGCDFLFAQVRGKGQAAEEFSTLVHEIAHLCGAEIYVALDTGCA